MRTRQSRRPRLRSVTAQRTGGPDLSCRRASPRPAPAATSRASPHGARGRIAPAARAPRRSACRRRRSTCGPASRRNHAASGPRVMRQRANVPRAGWPVLLRRGDTQDPPIATQRSHRGAAIARPGERQGATQDGLQGALGATRLARQDAIEKRWNPRRPRQERAHEQQSGVDIGTRRCSPPSRDGGARLACRDQAVPGAPNPTSHSRPWPSITRFCGASVPRVCPTSWAAASALGNGEGQRNRLLIRHTARRHHRQRFR